MIHRDSNRFNKIGAYLCKLTADRPEIADGSVQTAHRLFDTDPFVQKKMAQDIRDKGYDWAQERFTQCYQHSINQGRNQGVLDDRCYSSEDEIFPATGAIDMF